MRHQQGFPDGTDVAAHECQIDRAVAKTSSCQVYVINRRGIVKLGSSLGSIFLLFPMKVTGAHAHSNRGKSPAPGS